MTERKDWATDDQKDAALAERDATILSLRGEVEKLTKERDEAKIAALSAEEHARQVGDEAKAGFAALEEEDRFWDACGYPKNREVLTVSEQASSLVREIVAAEGERDDFKARAERAEATVSASIGYMMNAAIDLETGAPKKTALATINGGIKMAKDALASLTKEG